MTIIQKILKRLDEQQEEIDYLKRKTNYIKDSLNRSDSYLESMIDSLTDEMNKILGIDPFQYYIKDKDGNFIPINEEDFLKTLNNNTEQSEGNKVEEDFE